ncbi:MAG: hypothetical protein KKG01_05705, partial [Candidatus Omnitrophica bacterium]|nr:hypothetical protein [Candidatus Omnitrophota bacterium]
MKNILIIVFISTLILAGCSQSKTDEIRNTDDGIRYYTCGMHPSVKVSVEEYNKGNKSCPICNMNLTPVYKETKESKERKILFYRNPMNPSITSDVPTKDEMGMDYIPVYESEGADDAYYGCGMEGVEHVFLIKEIPGMKFCPICGMPLKKLSKDEADKLKGVVSTVKIKGNEIRLAGVQTESLKKLHLYKEIRTVGRVAYDPELAIAQEEFIAALEVSDKIQQG